MLEKFWERKRKKKIRIIIVLIAVATFESIFFIPIFAKIDVRPANNAELKANKSHIYTLLLINFYYNIYTSKISVYILYSFPSFSFIIFL